MKIKCREMASIVLDALYPRRCPVCGDIAVPKGVLICPSCLDKLSFVKSPVCKKCGKELMSDTIEYCFDCSRRPRTFEYGTALLNYNEAASRSMAAVKYKNKREYLDFYASEAVKRCGRELMRMKADCLIPIPIHPARMRARGFNQAQVLAEKMGRELGIPVCSEILKRNKNTEPQKNLNPSERLTNLRKAFTAEPVPAGINSVILIDDIYTTGSTMEACSRVLKAEGIKNIYFFTVCIGHGQ